MTSTAPTTPPPPPPPPPAPAATTTPSIVPAERQSDHGITTSDMTPTPPTTPPPAPAPALAPAPAPTPGAAPATQPSPPFNYKEMLESPAYGRLRAQHPAEFEPASVFFTQDPRSAIDRRSSLRVKAALVYEAVTGRHDDDDDMLRANLLLEVLAENCHSKIIHGRRAAAAAAAAAAEEGGGDEEVNVERVLDGIFLVVGFLPKLKEAIAGKTDRDAVDQSFRYRNMLDIVTDVIKLENQQLRVKDLLDVARHVGAAIKDTLEDHRFQEVKTTRSSFMDREHSKLAVTEQNLGDVIHGFCWYYSPFSTRNTAAAAEDSPFKDVAGKPEMAERTLLDCLHMSVVKPARGKGRKNPDGGGRPSLMPTARDLRRSGVRLQAVDDGRAEIEFSRPTLRLPALVFDFKLATVARNLLAREYEEQSKPVTRYFQMMNELVEHAGDVRILRRAGVVRGGGRGHDVLELVRNIDGRATYPSVCMAMDREIDKVREYHDQRMASFFVRNRPGVIWASSVAAVSVAAFVATRRNRG